MHIVHVNLARGFRGGERQTELLITALAELGLRQTLVCRPVSPMLEHLANCPGLDVRTVSHMLSGHLRPLPGQLCHAHDGKGAHWAYWARRRHALPYIITRRVTNPLKRNPWTRDVYRKASEVVSLSSAIADSIRTYIPNRSTRVIPSMCASLPVDPQEVRSLRARWPGKFIVTQVGALVDRHKGQRLLLHAARKLQTSHPQLQFILVGDGEDADILRHEAATLPNVYCAGFQNNVGDWLAACDLFVFPSRMEGLGSTLIDAMQHGLPIIASAVDGIPDLIQHEDNGLLFPAADGDALSQAIIRLHANAALRQQLGAAGKKRAERYTPARIAAEYLGIYREFQSGV